MAKNPANTRTLKRLADLFVGAYELISKEKRSNRSIDEVLLALQLFKEGKLEGVVCLSGDDVQSPLLKARAEFKRRLASQGEASIWREFLLLVSQRARTAFRYAQVRSFRELLEWGDLRNLRNVGAETYKEIEDILTRLYGLYSDMSKSEIEEVFGPPVS